VLDRRAAYARDSDIFPRFGKFYNDFNEKFGMLSNLWLRALPAAVKTDIVKAMEGLVKYVVAVDDVRHRDAAAGPEWKTQDLLQRIWKEFVCEKVMMRGILQVPTSFLFLALAFALALALALAFALVLSLALTLALCLSHSRSRSRSLSDFLLSKIFSVPFCVCMCAVRCLQ
jgi:hypothetical protein